MSDNDNFIRLFWDKFAGDHTFDNSVTSKISIDDLEDGTYKLYLDKEAFDYYNKEFSVNFKIPSLNSQMYKLVIYTKILDGIRIILTIIEVNSKENLIGEVILRGFSNKQ